METGNQGIKKLLVDIQEPAEEREPQMTAPITAAPEEKAASENKEKVQTEKPALDPLDPEMLSTGADMFIALFDLAQLPIFRWLINRKKDRRIVRLYGEEALTKLANVIGRQEASENKSIKVEEIHVFTAEELGMLQITKRAEELIGDLPLSEKEKDFIRVPLIAIMKQRGGTIPPEYMLALGLIQIAGSRAGSIMML